MYYPFLRGRQFELLALRELLEKKLISQDIIRPIIEPIKNTPVFNNTLSQFVEKNYPIYLVANPQNGSFDFQKFKENDKIFQNAHHKALIIGNSSVDQFYELLGNKEFVTISTKNSDFGLVGDLYQKCIFPKINFIEESFKNRFLRHVPKEYEGTLGIIEDNFQKADRNVDYNENISDFFSDQHLVYNQNNYVAFSDYSVIGNQFVDGGFAPKAVVIHVIYFDDNNDLYVKHFKSNSNDDTSDPAGKFGEALEKLVEWYKGVDDKNKSNGMNEFVKLRNEKRYPGLGVVKKLSIMHHLEIMNNFLKQNKGTI